MVVVCTTQDSVKPGEKRAEFRAELSVAGLRCLGGDRTVCRGEWKWPDSGLFKLLLSPCVP